jgi:magnesium-transporting ATPase (P-type)
VSIAPDSDRAPPGAPASPTRAWHAVGPAQALAALGTPPGGLTDGAAEERLRRHGPNRVEPPPPATRIDVLLRQLRSPLILVLAGATALSVILGRAADALFIAAVIALDAVLGYVNERRAERDVHALRTLTPGRARVRRSGRPLDVPAEHVVPGDLLLLESGTRVSADGRVVDAEGLRMDESLLTGESVPVGKRSDEVLPPATPLADRRNAVWAGTFVVAGRGTAVVTATGVRTETATILHHAFATSRASPLTVRIGRMARVLAAAAAGLAMLVIGLGVVHGEPTADLLLGAVALAVSAVPEGLPVAITLALAIAVRRMAARRVVVRHLPAVEALGSCGVIATDKTGTLTRNEHTAERIVAGERYDVTGAGYAPEGAVLREGRRADPARDGRLYRLLRAACLANEGHLEPAPGPGAWRWSGDPTDVALLALARKAGFDPATCRAALPPGAVLPFESERRLAASFHVTPVGVLVCVKGAPEVVLRLCDTEPRPDGTGSEPLDRGRAEREVAALVGEGYRVLAIADAEDAPRPAPAGEPVLPRLVFLGLVAMTDPPRPDVPGAVDACRRAGIRVVMVTGDHARTAAAVAERVGLAEAGCPVLLGEELVRLDDRELAQRIHRYKVVARVSPRDKLRIVRAWQRRGELVAVTGDGVNDAPALRQADLGAAMGRSGTDAAREAADLVLLDDDFATLAAGVEEGRVAYDNVRKVTFLLISTGAGEVVLVLAALALGLPVPFGPVQLLWLNLVTNGIQDAALAFEPGEPDVLDRPPRHPRERVLDARMLARTAITAAVLGGIGLAAWATWMAGGVALEPARNLMVHLFVLFEIFHIGNARSETRSLFRISPLSNPFLLLGTAAALGVHVLATAVPPLRDVLGLSFPSAREVAVLALAASTVLAALELHKALVRWHGREKSPASREKFPRAHDVRSV